MNVENGNFFFQKTGLFNKILGKYALKTSNNEYHVMQFEAFKTSENLNFNLGNIVSSWVSNFINNSIFISKEYKVADEESFYETTGAIVRINGRRSIVNGFFDSKGYHIKGYF